MSAQQQNEFTNQEAAGAIDGQVDVRFQSGQWHDGKELSRKDARAAVDFDAAPNTVLIAEKALGAEFQEKKAEISEKVEDAKEAVSETIAEGSEAAQGLAARAYEKSAELLHTAYDKTVAPIAEWSAQAKETVLDTAAYAKETIVNGAQALTEKAVELKDAAADKARNITGFASAKAEDMKAGLEKAKEEFKEEASSPREPMPTGPLSELKPAELLLQKATINATADLEKVKDSSLPLRERAAAAADLALQQGTIAYEKTVLAAGNLPSLPFTKAAQAPPAPAAQQVSSE
jgi:hypothetical protein